MLICKIFLVENILHKRKYFLLFNCFVKITPKHYFLCLVWEVKNLLSKNGSTSQLLATTTKDKHGSPPPTQNPNWEEGKNRRHCFVVITIHRSVHHHPHKTHQNSTTHTTTTTTKLEIKENKNQ